MTDSSIFSSKIRIRHIVASSIVSGCVALAAQNAIAQQLGSGIKEILGQGVAAQVESGIQSNTSASSNSAQGNVALPGTASPQSPVDRGINRAVQGVLRGQAPAEALRSGTKEAVQSNLETPQQRMLRDQATQTTSRQLGSGAPNGQPWQFDSQGKAYYRDGNGQLIYANMNASNSFSTFGSDRNGQNSYGAQIQTTDRGVTVGSVSQGGFASNSGLRQGDVILKVNGQSVQNESAFVHLMGQTQYQQPLTLTILRNAQVMTINTTAPSSTNIMHSNGMAQHPDDLKSRVSKLEEEVKVLRKLIEESTRK
ncbi:MAG: PDZ domain-containing protein [Pirellulaceae bacterium]|nr:PDZ domain-containing protein [Pirellulaceae bacterium]